MQIYNLLEYSSNYFDTTGSLWFYSKDKASSSNNDIANINNFNYNFYCIKLCTSPNFKLHEKAKLLRKTEANAVKYISRKAAIAVSLKYVSNFWRSFEIPLINCKVELKLKWTDHCVLSAFRFDNNDPNHYNVIFTFKDTKLYVSLSAKDKQKLSK